MGEVTLDRLAQGIRAANAKGDVETVKKLGAAYRALQAGAQQAAEAPAGTPIPGGMSRQGEVSSNMEWAPGQAPRPSMADEALSFGRGVVDLPIIGPALADARRGLDANIASAMGGGDADTLKQIYQRDDEVLKSRTGGARTAGQITGSVAALAPLGGTALGGRLLGTVGTLPERLAMGAASGGGISGADTLARGGSIEDAGKSLLLGGALGLVFPAAGAVKNKLGQSMAQRSATNAAIKVAPAAADLKETARALFQSVDNSGVTIDTNKFGEFVAGLAQQAKKQRINPNLDPKATGAYQELIGALDDVQRNGGALTMSDMHTLRQIAQKAATSTEGRDAMFADMIVDGLDSFITKPGVAVLPPNRLGASADAGNELLKAISTWGRARRVSMIEDAIYKAKNQASGFENGLRTQFRQLLQNSDKRRLFNAAEIQAMEEVVRGNAVSNIAKLAGMFGFNIGGSGSANLVGGSLGLLAGGPVGAAVGALARKGSEKLTERAATRAAKVVATPNVPVLPKVAAPDGFLPPALLPLGVTDRREPIRITVRGGSTS